MRSTKLFTPLITFLFIVSLAIGCNDESSKTNLAPTETTGDDNGSVQDKRIDESGAIDDESQSVETGTDGADEKKMDEESTEANATE